MPKLDSVTKVLTKMRAGDKFLLGCGVYVMNDRGELCYVDQGVLVVSGIGFNEFARKCRKWDKSEPE